MKERSSSKRIDFNQMGRNLTEPSPSILKFTIEGVRSNIQIFQMFYRILTHFQVFYQIEMIRFTIMRPRESYVGKDNTLKICRGNMQEYLVIKTGLVLREQK